MLSVTIKTIMLNVVILSVVMLNDTVQNVVAPVKTSVQWSWFVDLETYRLNPVCCYVAQGTKASTALRLPIAFAFFRVKFRQWKRDLTVSHF